MHKAHNIRTSPQAKKDPKQSASQIQAQILKKKHEIKEQRREVITLPGVMERANLIGVKRDGVADLVSVI